MSGEALQDPAQDRSLGCLHARGGGLGKIVVAVKVKQAVDDVEAQLMFQWLGILQRVTGGGLGADDDFTMLESDDIGRAGDIHEPPMNFGNGPVRHDADLDFVQGFQRRAQGAPLSFALGQRDRREPSQPGKIEADLPLAIIKVDGSNGKNERILRPSASMDATAFRFPYAADTGGALSGMRKGSGRAGVSVG